jgi:phosphoribosylglycinamide formyltransferase 1
MTQPRKRTVILISGRGSNMAALIEAAREKEFPAQIVGVVYDRADAPGLKAAESFGIPTRVVPRKDHPTAEAHEKTLDAALARLKAEIVCLAGYMRVLTAGFVDRWQGRLVNIHPALLPAFPGLDTHRRALDAGLLIHGCSVHFVTHEVDTGPLIAQAAVPVLVGDRPEQLSQRVLKAEHKLYPLALALLAAGKVRLEGGRAVFADIDQSARTGTLISPASWQGPSDLEDLARITP